jgi:hypothetical protein
MSVYLHRGGSSVFFSERSRSTRVVVLGVEVSIGGSTESNVMSFEAFFFLFINYTKYLIIKLSLLK